MDNTTGKGGEKRCTFALIDSLCDDLCKVECMPHPLHRVLPWIGLACLYVLGSVFAFGLRFDIDMKIHQAPFMFEMLMVTAVAVSAAFCSIWLCIPDMRGQKWMIVVPAVLFSAFLVWTALRIVLEKFHVPPMEWHICWLEALVFGGLPALAIFILSMRGKTTHPYLLSFMNALAVGGFGYLGLRLTCSSEDIGHICLFHILPYVLFGLIASLIGRRIYRW